MKDLKRICPICSHLKGEVLHHQSFEVPEGFLLPSEYDIVCCENCGFVFADVEANQETYSQYYRELAKYQVPEATTNWSKNEIPLPLLPSTDAVLDIGCATGDLLVKLKQEGCKNLAGIDLSEKCLEEVRKKGFRAFQGDFLTYHFEEKFDYIILSHVLEHIYDLRKTISIIENLLTNDGVVYIEVPDFSRYASYCYAPFHYFDHEHINHFDEDSLNHLFFDFEIIQIGKKTSYVSDKAYPAIFGEYLSKKGESVFDYNRYIEESKKRDNYPEIDKLAESQETIVVWGVGAYTMRLLKNTSLGKCNIKFFIDKHKEGKIRSLPIYSDPEKLRDFEGTIVVSSVLHDQEIIKEIKKMRLKNDIETTGK